VVNAGIAHSDLSINQILSTYFACHTGTTCNPEKTENKLTKNPETLKYIT